MSFIKIEHLDYDEVWINTKAIITMTAGGNAGRQTTIRMDDGSIVLTPTSPSEIIERMKRPEDAVIDWIENYSPGKEEELR